MYMYSHVVHTSQHFSVWCFMPKNQNCTHSLWLILYFNTLDLKCMKHSQCSLIMIGNAWNGLRVHYAVIVILLLINYFIVLYFVPKRLVGPAVLRLPELCMWSMYTKITFCRQTSEHLKGNDWTEWLYHVAQTQLHKIQQHSFLIHHSWHRMQWKSAWLHGWWFTL